MFSRPKSKPVEKKKKKLLAAGTKGRWRQLKKDILAYIKIRELLFEQMENIKDPRYQYHLQFYKKSLTPQEYNRARMNIYADCNQRAMDECLSVDEMVQVIALIHPLTYLPIPDPEYLRAHQTMFNSL